MKDTGCLVCEHDSGSSYLKFNKHLEHTAVAYHNQVIASYNHIIPSTVPMTLLRRCSDHGQRPQLGAPNISHQPTVSRDQSALLHA